ncbi:MAG TPA: dienelactone hydrolase family protein [Phycisphaerae bacterium]|nr:dienelactone hydrolase family protein [Phycisphaerae bacterium]
MRCTVFVVAAVLLAGSAFAQIPNVKQRVTGNLNNAVEQHNEDLNNAMNGTDNQQQQQQMQQPQQPGSVDGVTAGWITRPAKDGKTKVRLYFAYPQNLSKQNPVPGLIVLQEWWGVNDDIQDRTRDFAKHGFYAVAPDLYNGQVTDEPLKAAQLKQEMRNPIAMVDMRTGLDLLTEEEGNGVVDPTRVGAIGWCMGGEQCLLLSLADPHVKATVIFYGPLVTDPERLKSLQGPVLGIFGNNDKNPSPSDVDKFKQGLGAAGKTDITIYQYDGVGHAFASKAADKLGLYNPDKAQEAWQRTWGWLDAKLLQKK